MRKLTTIIIVALTFLFSCTETENYKKPDDPLEAGRDFIRFALDGNMIKAKTFILDDVANARLFEKIEKKYNDASATEKAAYKDASIIINKAQNINDSTTIINYSNSYKKENNEIKLVKVNGEWWVDFKYTFMGDTSEK